MSSPLSADTDDTGHTRDTGSTSDSGSTEQVARRYYATIADLGSGRDDLLALVAPSLRVTEHPNALTAEGAVRDLDAVLLGFEAGKRLLREQRFDVHEVIAAGERAAVRATWSGVIGTDAGGFHAGQELLAHVVGVLTVRDGRVVEHETFDCYEPFRRADAAPA